MKVHAKTVERVGEALRSRRGATPPEPTPLARELLRKGTITAEEQEALALAEPLVETMFLMMGADGVAARTELDLVWEAATCLTGGSVRSEAIKALVGSYMDQLKRDGWKARILAVASALRGDPERAAAAMALAAAVALADGDITLEENVLVDQLAQVLGIDDDRSCAILDRARRDLSDEG